MHPLGCIDRHLHLAGMLGISHRGDLYRAEQPGFDQRSSGPCNLDSVIDLIALPAKTALYIGRVEPLEPFDRDRPEAHHGTGIERVGHLHRLCGLVDLDMAVLYLGKRMSATTERRQQGGLGRYHRSGARWVAGVEARHVEIDKATETMEVTYTLDP